MDWPQRFLRFLGFSRGPTVLTPGDARALRDEMARLRTVLEAEQAARIAAQASRDDEYIKYVALRYLAHERHHMGGGVPPGANPTLL